MRGSTVVRNWSNEATFPLFERHAHVRLVDAGGRGRGRASVLPGVRRFEKHDAACVGAIGIELDAPDVRGNAIFITALAADSDLDCRTNESLCVGGRNEEAVSAKLVAIENV
jgi:hypothetical protein